MSTVKDKVTFGKIFWPTFVAIIITSVVGLMLFFLILGGIIGGLSSEFETKPFSVSNNTVLHLKLSKTIKEVGSTEINPFEFQVTSSASLNDLLIGIKSAKTDNNIKGIYIELDALSCGFATAMELRDALEDFKKSGKFIIAYHSGEVISQKEYFLASVADENYGFPSSVMEFEGLGVEMMYFKHLFDKLSVEMQIIRGRDNAFKSAVEPYFLDKMSDSSRVQVERYLTSIWADVTAKISLSRNVSVEKLNEIADNSLIRRATDAVEYNLLDATLYQDQVLEKIREKLQLSKSAKLKLVELSKYARNKANGLAIQDEAKTPNIAIIIAQGEINRSGDEISSIKLVKQIREARNDKNIKTIVLRVNSPGGSALASEEIWREVWLANQSKKVVVSMGDVAASGGYFISAAASHIFAEPTTITGSIGVFGVIPYTGGFLTDKVGLTFDRAGTNKHSVLSTNRKLTEEELAIIQEEVNHVYDEFLGVVAKGRNLTTERVNEIARGRVWTGRDAIKIGLVDELGGITDAINYAIKQADISNPIFAYYPKREENKFAEILQMMQDQKEEEENNTSETKISTKVLELMNTLSKLENIKGVQMRMPFYMEIH